MIPSDDLATWLQQNALTVVPVAAAELLERRVDERLELDRVKALLREAARSEGDASLANLLQAKSAQVAALTKALEAQGSRVALAERVVRLLLAGKPAASEIDAWRQAVKEQEAA